LDIRRDFAEFAIDMKLRSILKRGRFNDFVSITTIAAARGTNRAENASEVSFVPSVISVYIRRKRFMVGLARRSTTSKNIVDN
jgi:hypothetical protein